MRQFQNLKLCFIEMLKFLIIFPLLIKDESKTNLRCRNILTEICTVYILALKIRGNYEVGACTITIVRYVQV